MLTPSSLPPGERELYSKIRQVLGRPGILRGNLVVTRPTCGKASCRCRRRRPKGHPALYLGISVDGKRRMIYVPAAWEERVREWVDRYAHIRGLLERLCQACMKRLQGRKE